MSDLLRTILILITVLVFLYLFYRLVMWLLVRWQAQAAPPPVEEAGAEPPTAEIPTIEAPAADELSVEEAEAAPAEAELEEFFDTSFAIPAGVAPPPAVIAPIEDADVNLTLPPDVIVESFEPKYNFNWQNPTLRKTIYPFRKEKLIDILAFYAEVELVKRYCGQASSNELIQVQVKKVEAELRAARKEVDDQLNALILKQQHADKYFAGITGDEKSRRFKQKYYLDREIDRLEDSLDVLRDRKATLRKRLAWWPNDPERRGKIKCQLLEFNAPIRDLRRNLKPVKELRALFDRQDELPEIGVASVSMENIMSWEIRDKRQKWDQLDHDQLLREVIELINSDPNRFPEWLVYMLIHFSGMRYISAHSSWADPRDLIELLFKEDEEEVLKTKAMKEPQTLAQLCTTAIKDLQIWLKPGLQEDEKKSITRLIARLQQATTDWRALLEYRVEKLQKEIKNLTDDQVLGRLVQYKADRERAGDPLPQWMWSEIVKNTPLRLNTSDANWEAYSPERWKSQSGQWAEVLNTWQKKDITSWRKRHEQTLELVVTKSVCNEIAEQIQHLRGHTPYAGLTSKPKWYQRLATNENTKDFSYIKQAPDKEDFRPGASILWLQWMAQKPSPWQVAYAIPGYTFIPNNGAGVNPGQRGEVRKKDLVAQDLDDDSGWTYLRQGDNTFIRKRKKLTPQELKAMGKTPAEIKKLTAEYAKTGSDEIEYLRWRHEATVVDVVEMIDGWIVLTFETGNIGLIRRPLSTLRGSPMVFVGYVPDLWSLPEDKKDPKDRLLNVQQWKDNDARLVRMLDWNRILPGSNLKSRVRPKTNPLTKDTMTITRIDTFTPQRQVLVIRDEVRVYTTTGRDNQNRPKFVGAPPIKLHRGDLLLVYDKIRESQHDAGDGIIKAMDGEYVKISQSSVPGAVGKYLRRSEIEFVDRSQWMVFKAQSGNVNFEVIKYYDTSRFKKPKFESTPITNPVSLNLGQPGINRRVRVSTIHAECPLDKGDGVIQSTGLMYTYYLVLECPALPKARGYFIKTDLVISEH